MARDAVERYRDRILHGGSVLRTLLWLSWPMIVANLVQMTYNLVDALWLGRLGRQAFGAPTVSWPIIMLVYSVGMGFAQAGMTLVSQYFGAGDREAASRCVCQLITLLSALSISLSIAGFLAIPTILKLMGVPPDVYPLAVSYARTIFVGIPIAFLGFAYMAILSALGDTRTPMKLNIVSALINVVLDPILIFGLLGAPRLGVVGAALATIVARSYITGLGLYKLVRGVYGIKLRLSCMRIEGWWIRKVVSIGVPISIQSSANALGFTVMMSIVSRFGSVVVAAYGVGIRIIDIIDAFTWGIQRATSIIIGQCIGAERYERALRVARTGIALVTTLLAAGSVAIYFFRKSIISLFVPDPLVVEEGSRFLSYFVWSIPFFGMFFVCNGVAQGSGHPRTMAAIGIARLWLFRIGLSTLLALHLGMGSTGIWIAMTISNIFAGIASLAWLCRRKWLRRVIEHRTTPNTVSTPPHSRQTRTTTRNTNANNNNNQDNNSHNHHETNNNRKDDHHNDKPHSKRDPLHNANSYRNSHRHSDRHSNRNLDQYSNT